MKKTLIFAALFAVMLSACQGPQGPKGEDSNWFVTSFTVNSNEWRLSGQPNDLNSYYYADKIIENLTDFIFEEGIVIAYIKTGNNVKNEMPFVFHRGDSDGTNESLWTETYDFDFYPGGITFYVTYSDFSTAIRPGTETFYVVLMW
ncbi:MAG: lipoprotein [Prevotellaceae bacterium]|nr:lipoprotein [Prevotellaceae bacterium]